MKKFTAILLTVIMVASLFTSCSNSIAPNITDETVSVSFSEATSRSLTASLDDFDANHYFWAYKAVKTDSTGLNSGATNFSWIKSAGTGLEGVTIPGFSQGAWEFELYAYNIRAIEDASGNSALAYTGKTNVVLTKGGEDNIVSVKVSPISSGNGTLVIDIANIKIMDFNETILDDNYQGSFVKEVTIHPIAVDGEVPEPKTGENITTYTYDAKPGAYKVSVGLQQDGITFASGSVVATVYSNLTTTVSGTLREQITDATFDPSRNPDVMNLVASSHPIDLADKDDAEKIKFSSAIPEGETEPKIKAEVEAKAGKDLIDQLSGESGEGSAELKAAASHEIALALSVDTTSASEKSVSYEISLSSTITSKDSSGKVTATEVYPVSNLTKYLTAKIQLQKNLANVIVTHNGQGMQKLNSINETVNNENGAYHYAIDSGTLTIMTKKFSPFEVRYSKFVADMNGRKFASVQDAMDAVSENGGTVTLLEDVDIESPIEVSKTVIFDLNGKTISNTQDIWNEESGDWSLISVKGGDLTITGNGSLIAKANDCFAADLRAGGKLVIENGKFVGNIDVVYVYEGSLSVNGGDFSISQLSDGSGEDRYKYLLNCYDPNYKGYDIENREYTGPATIEVTGGAFHGFNPANNKAEGNGTNFVTEGYKVNQVNDTYNVVSSRIFVENFIEFTNALNVAEEGDIITLKAVINPTNNFTFSKSVTIDMNGYGFVRAKEASGGYSIKLNPGCNLTMKNGRWDMAGTFGNISAEGSNGECIVKYENVTFSNLDKPTQEELAAKPGNSSNLVKTAFKANMQGNFNVNASFSKCVFNNAGVEFGGFNSGNTYVAEFKNCTFNNIGNAAAINANAYGMSENCKIKATNCTFNITVTSNVSAIGGFKSTNKVSLDLSNNIVNGTEADRSFYKVSATTLKFFDNTTFIATESGTDLEGIATLN